MSFCLVYHRNKKMIKLAVISNIKRLIDLSTINKTLNGESC